MITAIFNKSKPINLVLASLLLVLGSVIIQLKSGSIYSWNSVLYNFAELCVAVFSILLIDFIVKKNSISEQNSFVILFYSIFCFCFWNSSETLYLMLSNLFVLLALRKIISLKTQTNTTQKIFDAGLWICIATLFHFWAILFFLINRLVTSSLYSSVSLTFKLLFSNDICSRDISPTSSSRNFLIALLDFGPHLPSTK